MKISCIETIFLVLLLASPGSAAEQKAEIVLGLPEVIDFRYGIEWKYGGVAISPGIGFLSLSRIRDDELIPVTWNPTLSFYKNFKVVKYFGIAPSFTIMYMYGFGGMNAQSGCLGCSEDKIRIDALYLKESLGFRFSGQKFFFEINPGYVVRHEYEITTGEDLNRDKGNGWKSDGIWASGSIGLLF